MKRKDREMLNSVKHNLLFVLQNAKLIDFLTYGWIFLAFILIVLLGIFIAIKSWWQIGFLFILAGFFGLFVGNYYANKYINENLRPVSISKIITKQLQYVDALMVDFNITNNSNNALSICKIELDFYLSSRQNMKDFFNSLNPFARKRIILNEEFLPKQSIEVKEFVNDFAFIDYNISKKVECF
ncbi:DUF2393 family protein [Campylobacter concisus]